MNTVLCWGGCDTEESRPEKTMAKPNTEVIMEYFQASSEGGGSAAQREEARQIAPYLCTAARPPTSSAEESRPEKTMVEYNASLLTKKFKAKFENEVPASQKGGFLWLLQASGVQSKESLSTKGARGEESSVSEVTVNTKKGRYRLSLPHTVIKKLRRAQDARQEGFAVNDEEESRPEKTLAKHNTEVIIEYIQASPEEGGSAAQRDVAAQFLVLCLHDRKAKSKKGEKKK
eukprot:GHVQ01034802.1.p1 GENE.GHVQ01034802.1~~GHVQ01034802.1.p1  ORF type:complete len:231 (-),score=45.17 GHVQ01034802.1:235-927(-)